MDNDQTNTTSPTIAPTVESVTDLLATIDTLTTAADQLTTFTPETWGRLGIADLRHHAGRVEAARKKLTLTDTAVITVLDPHLPATPVKRVRHLAAMFHTTRADARARLAAFHRLAPRPDPWAADPTAAHPEHMPALTDLVRTGRIDHHGVAKADKQIRALPDSVHDEITRVADRPIAELADTQGPDILDALRPMLLDFVGADEPYRDPDHQRMRSFTLGTQGVDGMTPVKGLLTPTLAAAMHRLMADYATTGSLLDNGDSDGAGTAEPGDDERSPEQRRHDALAAAIHSGYRPGGPLTPSRGATTIVAVTSLHNLINRTGTAWSDTGVRIPVSTITRDCDSSGNSDGTQEPGTIPGGLQSYLQILGFDARTLYLGRSRRLGSLEQYYALCGEEGASTAPGTDSAPAHCHVHHIDDWHKGGPTDLDNLTLVNPPAHAKIDDTRTDPTRWQTRRADPATGRRVDWIPPEHIDPTRTPQHNDHPGVWTHPGQALRRQLRQQAQYRDQVVSDAEDTDPWSAKNQGLNRRATETPENPDDPGAASAHSTPVEQGTRQKLDEDTDPWSAKNQGLDPGA